MGRIADIDGSMRYNRTMASHSQYKSFEISWRETGEKFFAIVQVSGDRDPPAIITASVEEGMTTLKLRTHAIIDAGSLEAYRPNLSMRDDASPFRLFMQFLSHKESELGVELLNMSEAPRRLSRGWAFSYQARDYVEHGNLSQILVGHGPIIITDDGEIIETGSLDRDL